MPCAYMTPSAFCDAASPRSAAIWIARTDCAAVSRPVGVSTSVAWKRCTPCAFALQPRKLSARSGPRGREARSRPAPARAAGRCRHSIRPYTERRSRCRRPDRTRTAPSNSAPSSPPRRRCARPAGGCGAPRVEPAQILLGQGMAHIVGDVEIGERLAVVLHDHRGRVDPQHLARLRILAVAELALRAVAERIVGARHVGEPAIGLRAVAAVVVAAAAVHPGRMDLAEPDEAVGAAAGQDVDDAGRAPPGAPRPTGAPSACSGARRRGGRPLETMRRG